ncbi:MAG: pyruvoyl-dependent arginine decarboxylase [Candidatus Aenigmarchaeota archaeon]|nr:pyruvoyl-dependent arginine decarboxylase [Candidatus Aenigmarchaeota archaeon]
MKIGFKVPKKFFVTRGRGESDLNVYVGALDTALKDAEISDQNIVFYTSILPPDIEKIEKPRELPFGAVLETIMAISKGSKGERVTAGLIIGWVLDKSTKERVGGLVAEYHGNKTEDEAKKELISSVTEMFRNRFDEERFELKIGEILVESFVPKKKFGVSIVAICFTEFEFQTIS